MKAVGIICEYNPFHNGHLYHLKQVKKMCKDYTVILVMSSSFLQRGEVSMINKWDKTKIALDLGIDLVIELPFCFSTQSADIFAKGAITILNHLKVDKLIFGSELNDIDLLNKLATYQLTDQYNKKVKQNLKEGINYPKALAKALKETNNIEINTPNDILGISYIKEIKKLNSKITPLTIKRTNDYHSEKLNGKITSAKSIRLALKNKQDIKNYVPKITTKYLTKPIFIDDYFNLLKYKILSEDHLEKYLTVDEGIENRLKKFIVNSNSISELINNVKTKRYTYNKISRMLVHILCNFTKEEALKYTKINYIRPLGFNSLGQKYLNQVKKEIEIPIITKYNKLLDLELRITSVYASILDEKDKQKLIKDEYQKKPIIDVKPV